MIVHNTLHVTYLYISKKVRKTPLTCLRYFCLIPPQKLFNQSLLWKLNNPELTIKKIYVIIRLYLHLQVHSSFHTSSSLWHVAFPYSYWRQHWASIPVRGESCAGGRSVLYLKVRYCTPTRTVIDWAEFNKLRGKIILRKLNVNIL